MKNKKTRWCVFCILLLGIAAIAVVAIRGSLVPRTVPKVASYEPWSPELVELVEAMPVQEGGRLKPFSTWSMFRLYSIHSKRKIKIEVEGEKVTISPTEWMLDCIFRHEVADSLPSFRVEDSQIAEALSIQTGTFRDRHGVEVYKKKRDLYTYDEIFTEEFKESFAALNETRKENLAEGKVLKGFDQLKMNLVTSIWNYTLQKHVLEMVDGFTQDIYKLQLIDGIARELGTEFSNEEKGLQWGKYLANQIESAREEHGSHLSDDAIMAMNAKTVREKGLEEMKQKLGGNPSQQELEAYFKEALNETILNTKLALLSGRLSDASIWNDSQFLELRMMPAALEDDYTWVSHKAAMKWFMTEAVSAGPDERVKITQALSEFSTWANFKFVYDNFGEKPLLAKLRNYKTKVENAVSKRGEDLSLVQSEVRYYEKKYYHYALGFFFLGVMSMILLLPAPHSTYGKVLGYIAIVCALIATAYVVAALIHRGVIMQRYPLGKLYDTILVSTAVLVSVLCFMELLSRRKVCIGVAVTFGLIGMFLARSFEVGNGSDTLAPLQAVLNSDYWLITHVTCIIIGYAGGLVAAGISTFYILARVTGIDEGDKSFRRAMTRLAYGAACFTLIFSLIGTILGGVWANDSWGRFWGWDPKENGALMIVLWFLAVLHARLGGYVKDWGVHICLVLGANVIAFSWWGVNFLSTGLHNYGFASGGDGEFYLNLYYILNTTIAVIAFGFAWYEVEVKKLRKREKEAEKNDEELNASSS